MRDSSNPVQIICTGISYLAQCGCEEELAKAAKCALASLFLVWTVQIKFIVGLRIVQLGSHYVQSPTNVVPSS